mmetsp:Transcript_12499/g.34369  ORF Transcript_12499/g.34369 Transcript_12499/m.34369 type:complete len:203 (-) Transcript_12499:230-838(-)
MLVDSLQLAHPDRYRSEAYRGVSGHRQPKALEYKNRGILCVCCNMHKSQDDMMHCEDVEELDSADADFSFEQAFERKNDGSTVIEGTLEKRGYWNPSWKARHFVLDNKGRMFYYKSKDAKDSGKSAVGRIALNRFCLVTRRTDPNGEKYFLDLFIPANGQHRDRTFHLSASDSESCEQWAGAIESVKQKLLYTCFHDKGSWW